MIEKGLRALAKAQYKYTWIFFFVILLFTSFMFIGISNIKIESDMSKEYPQDLPIFTLDNKVTDEMGNQESIFVLFKLEDSQDIDTIVRDIRDPDVVNTIQELQNRLQKEPIVTEVTSIATIIQEKVNSKDQVNMFFKQVPQLKQFTDKRYTATIMVVQADIGSSEEQIKSITKLIDDNIAATSMPPGLSATVTGNPPMRVLILQLLQKDAINTLTISCLLIFFLLLLITRNKNKTILVFIPLVLGVGWTIGMLGWIDMALSVATVGLGAMILGLGVEYGIFVVERFHEERGKGSSTQKSIEEAVVGVGTGITGSGLTTIVGFGALSLSTMPMLQHLGQTLALGIAFSMLAALVANPIFIIIEEKIEYYYAKKNSTKMKKVLEKNEKK